MQVSKEYRNEKTRIRKRQEIGDDWNGRPNVEGPQSWPLAKALIAEGNHELLKYAIKYRQIYDDAKSEAMLGGTSPQVEGMNFERVLIANSNGSVTYGKTIERRDSDALDTPPQTANIATEETRMRSSGVPKPWAGDVPVNKMIDAKRLLALLQTRIGVILEPFEMAVVENSTLAEIGALGGASSRDGKPAAGRAICHMGLIFVRDFLKGNKFEL